jgi:hypothetical protein
MFKRQKSLQCVDLSATSLEAIIAHSLCEENNCDETMAQQIELKTFTKREA